MTKTTRFLKKDSDLKSCTISNQRISKIATIISLKATEFTQSFKHEGSHIKTINLLSALPMRHLYLTLREVQLILSRTITS